MLSEFSKFCPSTDLNFKSDVDLPHSVIFYDGKLLLFLHFASIIKFKDLNSDFLEKWRRNESKLAEG
jgi:hypothetical protein